MTRSKNYLCIGLYYELEINLRLNFLVEILHKPPGELIPRL